MSDIKITYDDGADKHGTLEGSAFMGSMLNGGECAAIVFGKLSPKKMMDITASNLAAFISVRRQMKDDPREILGSVMDILAASLTKTLEQMKDEKPGKPNAHDMEFLMELLKLIMELERK